MTIIIILLVGWFAASIITAIILGKAIRVADRKDRPTTRNRKEHS